MDVLSAVTEVPAAVKYSSIGIWLPQVFLLKKQKYKAEVPYCGKRKQDCGNYTAKLVMPRFHQMMFGHQSNVAKKRKDTFKSKL